MWNRLRRMGRAIARWYETYLGAGLSECCAAPLDPEGLSGYLRCSKCGRVKF